MYPEIYNPVLSTRYKKRGKQAFENAFTCGHCHAPVYTHPVLSGVQNRNHCPFCLWSRHVDHIKVGDRLSACKAIMQPIGLTMKLSQNKYGGTRMGELMLIHRCNECGKLSINRIAADDMVERLMEVFYASLGLERCLQEQVISSGIRLLQKEEQFLVARQLMGTTQN